MLINTILLSILLLGNNTDAWNECIELSNGSDIECEFCDDLFSNPNI